MAELHISGNTKLGTEGHGHETDYFTCCRPATSSCRTDQRDFSVVAERSGQGGPGAPIERAGSVLVLLME